MSLSRGEARIVRFLEAVLDGCGDISDRQRVANVRRALRDVRNGEHLSREFRPRRNRNTLTADGEAAALLDGGQA